MKFIELSLFQFSVGFICQQERTGPELREILTESGYPGINEDAKFYNKMRRCASQGIVKITQEKHGQTPYSYKTTDKTSKELARLKSFLQKIL